MYYSFINIDPVANSITHAQIRLTKHKCFLCKAQRTVCFCLGTPESTSALCLGTTLTREITNKEHKNVKMWHEIDYKRLHKGFCLLGGRKWEGSGSFFSLVWETVCRGNSNFLLLCACLPVATTAQ